MSTQFRFDQIGYWSEIKLKIIKRYGTEYSKILARKGFYHAYIDALSYMTHGGALIAGCRANVITLGVPSRAPTPAARACADFLKEHHKVQESEKQVKKLTAGLQKVSAQLEASNLQRKRS